MFYIKANPKVKPCWIQSYGHIRITVSQPSKFPKPPPNQIPTARNPKITLAVSLMTITLCRFYPTEKLLSKNGALRFPIPCGDRDEFGRCDGGPSPKSPLTLLSFLKTSWFSVADRQQARKWTPGHLHFRHSFENRVRGIFLDIINSCRSTVLSFDCQEDVPSEEEGQPVLKAALTL